MKTKQKPRLAGKRQPSLPKPDGKGEFSLKIFDLSDHRFAVIKRLRKRIDQLVEESGCNNLAGEMLAARAVHIAAYLETCEVDALEGKKIDQSQYLAATRTLADLLNKLGLKREASSAADLGTIIDDLRRKASKRKAR